MTVKPVKCYICDYKFTFDIPEDGVVRWNGTGLNCPKKLSHPETWDISGTVVLVT